MREKAGLTQEQVARALQVSQSAVAKWETGECKPRADIFPKLAQILKCSIDDLFCEKDKGLE